MRGVFVVFPLSNRARLGLKASFPLREAPALRASLALHVEVLAPVTNGKAAGLLS